MPAEREAASDLSEGGGASERGERAGRSLNSLLCQSVAHTSSRVACVSSSSALEPLCVVLRNKFDGKFVKFSERARTNVAMSAIIAKQTVTI